MCPRIRDNPTLSANERQSPSRPPRLNIVSRKPYRGINAELGAAFLSNEGYIHSDYRFSRSKAASKALPLGVKS